MATGTKWEGARSADRGRRIVITGGSRGIGLAAAKVLAGAGNRIVLVARSEQNLKVAAAEVQEAGGEPELYPTDLTSAPRVKAVAESILEAGPVDVLINCAGVLTQSLLLARTDEDLQTEMAVNYFGALRMTRAVLPTMIEKGRGVIVNVSSILAEVGTPTTANYCASKAALEAFSAALRGEVGNHGVRVVVFVAPHTQTELGHHADFRGVPSAPVDFVGRELARAVDTADAIHCAGSYLRVGRKLAAWAPKFMQRKLHRSVGHLL